MSYTKHEWVNNETITAAKLNNIEDGIEEAAQSGGGGALIVTYNSGANNLDKTVQEIHDAITSATPVYLRYTYESIADYIGEESLAPITTIYKYYNAYRVIINKPRNIGGISDKNYIMGPAVMIFSASALNEYPTYYATVGSSAYSL